MSVHDVDIRKALRAAAGLFAKAIRLPSGDQAEDERLEAIPTAELTADEELERAAR